MKFEKILGVLVFSMGILFCGVNGVLAESDIFNELKTYVKDGKEYLDIKAINPLDTPTNFCMNVYGDDEESKDMCKADYVNRYMYILLKKNFGIDDINGYQFDVTSSGIRITYCSDGLSFNCEVKDYNVIWEEYENRSELDMLLDSLKSSYVVYGDVHIGMAYHIDNFEYYNYLHGSIEKGNYDLVLSYYPEFKEVLEEYVDYDFVLIPAPSGGVPFQKNGGCMVGIIKDGVLLNAEYIDFTVNSVLLVPDVGSDNLIEKAQNVLKGYFNNTEKISISKDDDFDLSDEDIQYILKNDIKLNEYLNINDDIDYNYESVIIEVGNSILDNFVIVSVPKENYKQLVVKSKDKKTGVNIISGNLTIPIDIRINVENMKDDEVINKNGEDNNIVFDEIFDISLERRYDGSFVEQTPLGVEVYIPVFDYEVNDKVNIYYIKDNEVQDEIIEGIVVEVDNKLYVKFIAKHFSTYAIGKEISTSDVIEVDNPKTFDDGVNCIIIGILSLMGLVGMCLIRKVYIN